MRETRNLFKEEDGTIRALVGANIQRAILDARLLAADEGSEIAFEFNGITMRVASDSDWWLLYRDYNRAIEGCMTDKVVGPYPAELSEEQLARDEEVREKSRQKRATSKAAYRAKMDAKREALDAKLKGISMEVSDREAWQKWLDNNRDSYGGAVMAYAERWARLMQSEMDDGKELEEIARDTSHEADVEGITGFMYGCAVQVLSQCWRYGEELRTWHNLDTQVGDEGERANESSGVLNPALLSIGGEAN